jgi:hypothetical protein
MLQAYPAMGYDINGANVLAIMGFTHLEFANRVVSIHPMITPLN